MKKIIMYIIIGGFTTVINITIYYLLAKVLNFDVYFSLSISWLVAVLFAFFGNKNHVFKSEGNLTKSMMMFFVLRLLGLGFEFLIMFIGAKLLALDSFYVKIFTNILIIIINYVLSSKVIFK